VQVIGQTQDLMDLQRILRRSDTKLDDQAQQNLTRCARFLLHYWLQHVTTCLPAARAMVGVAPVMLLSVRNACVTCTAAPTLSWCNDECRIYSRHILDL